MKPKRPVLFSDYMLAPPAESHRAATVRGALAAAGRVPRGTSLAGQLRGQLAYIGPWFWLGLAGQLALMLFARWQLLVQLAPDTSPILPTLALFSVAGPLLAALAAPVLARSAACNMWELEESCFHNLPRLTTLRMLVCLLAALPVLAVLAAFGLPATGLLPGLLALLVPFLLACAANYAILGRLRGTAGSLCCLGACLMLALVCMAPFTIAEPLLAFFFRYGWAAGGLTALVVAAALCVLAARGLVRRAALLQ